MLAPLAIAAGSAQYHISDDRLVLTPCAFTHVLPAVSVMLVIDALAVTVSETMTMPSCAATAAVVVNTCGLLELLLVLVMLPMLVIVATLVAFHVAYHVPKTGPAIIYGSNVVSLA